MSEHGVDKDVVNHVARVLMDAWEKAEGKPVSPSYVATFADMARAVLAAPIAVTRQSPGGRSLTYCCCDRTTARLLVCPVHPEATSVTPPGGDQ